MTVIWSSPPIVARTARTSGSANAAFRSAALSCGAASRRRVVGYSTGSSPSTSRIRASACSCTPAPMAGAANPAETTATLSPGDGLGGCTSVGNIPPSNRRHRPDDTALLALERGRRPAQRLERLAYVVVGGAPVAHRDTHDGPVVPPGARHPRRPVRQQRCGDGLGALVVVEREADLGEDDVV